jgi:ABC-type polysaccharide/polyol phosphate export permease
MNLLTARVILSLIGLLAIAISLVLSFRNPVGLWHWALLIVALACLVASRRVR